MFGWSNTAGSRLAPPISRLTHWPRRIGWPAISVSSKETRPVRWTGASKRSDSCTAAPARVGLATRAAHWSGCSSSALTALPSRLTVVSNPAISSIRQTGTSSTGRSSKSPSPSEAISVLIRSSPGSARRSSMTRSNSRIIALAATITSRACIGERKPAAALPSASPYAARRAPSSSGIPSSRLITATGSGSARVGITSHVPAAAAPSRNRPTVSSMRTVKSASRRALSAGATSRRRRVWSGGLRVSSDRSRAGSGGAAPSGSTPKRRSRRISLQIAWSAVAR